MYADKDYYSEVFKSKEIPHDDIEKYLERASDCVDRITRMKIVRLGGFTALSDFQKRQVQLATCHQADYLYTVNQLDGVSSYSIGGVSVTMEATQKYSSDTISCLNLAGLTYRGL